jgi:hypothetical protein
MVPFSAASTSAEMIFSSLLFVIPMAFPYFLPIEYMVGNRYLFQKKWRELFSQKKPPSSEARRIKNISFLNYV